MRINCAGESGIVYRILIVDDEKIERTGLRLLLGKMDQKFEITEAVNGKEALEWLSCCLLYTSHRLCGQAKQL